MRIGVAAMIDRCVAEYDRRPGFGPGWLAKQVRGGGMLAARKTPRNPVLDAMDGWRAAYEDGVA